jgi:hypothetical protein
VSRSRIAGSLRVGSVPRKPTRLGVDFSSQRGGFKLGIFQPAQPADHVIAHIAQSPDQLTGLGGIPFTHRGIVSPAGAPGTLNRAAAKVGLALHTDLLNMCVIGPPVRVTRSARWCPLRAPLRQELQ